MFENPYFDKKTFKGIEQAKRLLAKTGLIRLPLPTEDKSLTARALLQTVIDGNKEISRPGLKRTYKAPEEILAEGNGEIRHITMWYLIDGIARWIVNSAQLAKSDKYKEKATDILANVICEGMLVYAMGGSQPHARMVKWMDRWGWYDVKYKLSQKIVAEAKNLSVQVPRFRDLSFFAE